MDNNTKRIVDVVLPRNQADDTVDSCFRIDLSREVSELSNEFCKHYYATNDSIKEQFFAVVFEKNFILQLDDLEFLSKNHIEGLNDILAYSVVRLSTTQEEHLVAIVNYYQVESTLLSYLQKGQTISEQQIETIICNINNVLIKLQKKKVFCCNINPSNILMKGDKIFVLREFITTYPNYHQKMQYIAPEFAECHVAGRFSKTTASDIYALGVLIFEAYIGTKFWNDNIREDTYNHVRFDRTTSEYLLRNVEMPGKLKAFLIGTMHDNASIRWDHRQIQMWLKGKKSQVVKLPDSIQDVANFRNSRYYTFKSLAYHLYDNWAEGVEFISDKDFLKNINYRQFDSDILKAIKEITRTQPADTLPVNTQSGINQKFSKLLALIDSCGAIRRKEIALSASSIPCLVHHLVLSNNKYLIDKIIEIIQNKDWVLYAQESKASGYLSQEDSNYFSDQISSIEFKSAIDGIERLIYSLNPTLVCQSKLLKGKYVTSIAELLTGLDDYTKQNSTNFYIDRHIIAFAAAKLNLQSNIKDPLLSEIPILSKHPIIHRINILSIMQQNEPFVKVTSICRAVIFDLKKVFDEYLHNINFKQQVFTKLNAIAKEGDFIQLINMLSNQQSFVNDHTGYKNACRQVKIMEQTIKLLDKTNDISGNMLFFGQKIIVLISYILCLVVAVNVVI